MFRNFYNGMVVGACLIVGWAYATVKTKEYIDKRIDMAISKKEKANKA